MEDHSLDSAPLRWCSRATPSPEKSLVVRSTRNSSNSGSQNRDDYALARYTSQQENEAGGLGSITAVHDNSNKCVEVVSPDDRTERNLGRRRRGKRQHLAGHWAQRSSTDFDSNSHSEGDGGGSRGSRVDGKEVHNITDGEPDGAYDGTRYADSGVTGNSTRKRRTTADAARVTAASTQPAGTAVRDVARQTVPLSTTAAPLAFSEAVDPFSSYQLPDRCNLFRRALSFAFFSSGKTVTWETSLHLPPLLESAWSFVRDRASLVHSALRIPVALVLIFVCVTLSVRLVLVLRPLRLASARFPTQLSQIKVTASSSSIRYCKHSQPIMLKSLLSVEEEASLLPLPSKQLTGHRGQQRRDDDCQPCPEHADCSSGRMRCLPPYMRVPAATGTANYFFSLLRRVAETLFRWKLTEREACVENVVARRTAEKLLERIVRVLQKRAGDAQCGSPALSDELSSVGHLCQDSITSQKKSTGKEAKGSRTLLSASSGAMTRWELLHAEELHGQFEDDSVYAYVFERFLEEKAALRLNVKVTQQYSFESMRLPRECIATASPAKNPVQDIVELFLREQRRSQGITYSYAYTGPHAVRSPLCVFRLAFMNTIVPLSFVLTAFSALAFPLAAWLRRLYLRRQLLLIMQLQQAEEQTLTSQEPEGVGFSPAVYCGCSSAHLSQLLVQKACAHQFSLLRWWLQRTATKTEEIDAMCLELLLDKTICVQTANHEGQNFWWVAIDSDQVDNYPAGRATVDRACPDAQALAQDYEVTNSLPPIGFHPACGALQAPADAADSLLVSQWTIPHSPSDVSISCGEAFAHSGVRSNAVCKPSRTNSHVDGSNGIQQADAYLSAMRCRISAPGPCPPESSTDSSAPDIIAATPRCRARVSSLFRGGARTLPPACSSSTVGCCSPGRTIFNVGSSHSASRHGASPGLTVEADKASPDNDISGCLAARLHLHEEHASPRTSNTQLPADYSFSAFLARVSDMQRTPVQALANQQADYEECRPLYGVAAEAGRGRSSVF